MICRKNKLPKLKRKRKKQLSRRKLMARLKEALLKVILNLFLLFLNVASMLVTTINTYSPTLKQKLISSLTLSYILPCGVFVYRVEK